MKIPTQDIDAYYAIKPAKVIEYLQEQNWQESGKIGESASIWERFNALGKKRSILLPLDINVPDYTARMYDVFRTLEAVENRSQIELFNDLVDVSVIAEEKNQEILNLKLDFFSDENKNFIYEASAKHLGIIMESMQKLLDAIGQIKIGRPNPFGKVSKDITDQTRVNVLGTFKGSFGIRLALPPSPQQFHLLDRPLGEQVIETFFTILQGSSEQNFEYLTEQLMLLQKRGAVNYRKFLWSLCDADANISLDWGSPNSAKGGSVSLSAMDALSSIRLIEKLEAETPQDYTLTGELLGADRPRKTFKIRNLEDDTIFSGKISDEVLSNTEVELTIDKLYNVTIREVISISSATGEGQIERTLIHINSWHLESRRNTRDDR